MTITINVARVRDSNIEAGYQPANGSSKPLPHSPTTSLPQIKDEDISDDGDWKDF